MIRFANTLSKICKLSPYDVWVLARRPGLLVTLPFRPASSTSTSAAVQLFPQRSRAEIDELYLEFLGLDQLFGEMNRAMVRWRKRHVHLIGWNAFLYMLVRLSKPDIFVETGVFDGQSSCFILEAMERNQSGNLVSIDLPATNQIVGSTHCMLESSLPKGLQPGWLVPDRLRGRYDLRLGDAKELLPRVLDEFRQIDIFFHDSLHTYEHMLFEFNTAWPHLRDGGFLISDDIHWNSSFHVFASRVSRKYLRVECFGALKK